MNARRAKRIRCNRPRRPSGVSEELYRNAKLIGGTAQVLAHGHAVRPITVPAALSPRQTSRRRNPTR